MTTYKFLIDECLSPELAEMAVQRGHGESTCVRNRGWSGLKDYQLVQRLSCTCGRTGAVAIQCQAKESPHAAGSSAQRSV